MKPFSAIWVVACWLFFSAAVGGGASLAEELIPPSRTLGLSTQATASLVVFSEPPELDVYLNEKPIGKTPLWKQKAESGSHTLRVHDLKRDITLVPDQTLTIGLFKGSFVILPPKEKQPAELPSLAPREEGAGKSEGKTAPETEKEREIRRWQRFITLGHF